MLCKVGSEKDVEMKHLKWLGSHKIDGCRCLAHCDEEIKLLGRNGTDYTNKFPEIVEELKTLGKGIFDGEVVCDNFDKTASRVHTDNKLKSKLLSEQYPATLWIFDFVCPEILSERLKKIEKINGRFVKYLEHTTDLIGLFEKAKKEDWEGIVLKNPNSFYSDKRSNDWLKVKLQIERFISFNQFELNNAGVKITDGFHTIQVSGSESKSVVQMIKNTGSCECEVRGMSVLPSGHIRQPVFAGVRKDV